MIPVLGLFEWHQYFISSTPNDNAITLHISQLGVWSIKLGKFIKENKVSQHMEITGFILGPYDLPSINVKDQHETIVFITGGNLVQPYIQY